MREYLAIIGMLALGACSAAQTTTATLDTDKAAATVYATKTGYAAVLTVAVAYNELPRCGQPTSPKLCSDVAVVTQLRRADAAASATINAAESAVRTMGSQPTVINAAVISAADALKAYQAIVNTYGIK